MADERSLLCSAEFPLALMVIIQQLIGDAAAVRYSNAVVFYARCAACAHPLYPVYIGHFNSGLDSVLKDLESYRAGRHCTYIKNCENIDSLSHFIHIYACDRCKRFLSHPDNIIIQNTRSEINTAGQVFTEILHCSYVTKRNTLLIIMSCVQCTATAPLCSHEEFETVFCAAFVLS